MFNFIILSVFVVEIIKMRFNLQTNAVE